MLMFLKIISILLIVVPSFANSTGELKEFLNQREPFSADKASELKAGLSVFERGITSI